MQTQQKAPAGLTLLWELNLDRFLFVGAIAAALLAAGYLGSL